MSKVAPGDVEAPAAGEWTPAARLEQLLIEKEAADYAALGGSPEALAARIGSDTQQGLSGDPDDLAKRVEYFGGNYFKEKKLTSYCTLIMEGCKDYTIIMLIVCAVISLIVEVAVPEDCHDDGGDDHRRLSECGGSIIHKVLEPIAIIVTVAVVLNVTAAMDYNKERMFAGLSKQLEGSNKKFVIRNGKSTEVTDRDIVVGDVVQFNAHMLASIPADGIIISGDGVKIDESALTGEPEPIAKNAENPFILSGTEVKFGSGTFLVTAVGARSTAGRIKAAVYEDGEDEEQSPLFDKLDKLAMDIGKLGMVVAIICLAASCINGFLIGDAPASDLIEYCINSITVLVVAVPEGLPLAVTLSLAVSSYQMMSDNNLVKHLAACETMGSATTICSDKTGTLTANRMTVRGAWLAGTMVAPDATAPPVGKRIASTMSTALVELLGNLIAIDTMNESFLLQNDSAIGGADFKGNPTECALLALGKDLGKDYDAIRKNTIGRNQETVDQGKAFMFQSARKMMSWAVPLPSGGYRIYCKGASEIVLSRCATVMGQDEQSASSPLTEQVVGTLQHDVISLFASEAMRTIGVAYRDFPSLPDWDEKHATVLNSDGSPAFAAETELTLVGVLGIEDPLRPEVPPAISKCNAAGIDVRMVTGDNLETAVAIASRCGILKAEHFNGDFDDTRNRQLKPDRAMTGKDFRRRVYTSPAEDGSQIFIQEEFDKIWPRLRVLARSSPEDKLTLANGLNKSTLCDNPAAVAELKQEGISIFPDRQVIAMTGDGTNDAPALKRADVGFAMGIAGTQIAKDAADIILLDDNFASIVTAANWGRNVFDAISKFLQFQLTVNIAALVSTVIGASMERVPIKAVQMLWVNLIMDSLASLALATEPPNEAQLKRPPVNRRTPIITPRMWHFMFGHAIYQVFWILILMFKHKLIFPSVPDGVEWEEEPENARNNKSSLQYTLVFNSFVLMQLFNEINSRKLFGEANVFEGICKNPWFYGIMVFTFVLQVIMVQTFGAFMSCYDGGLSVGQWVICLAIGAGELVWHQLINLFSSLAAHKQFHPPNKRMARHRSQSLAVRGSLSRSVSSA